MCWTTDTCGDLGAWQPACVDVHHSAEFSFGEDSSREEGAVNGALCMVISAAVGAYLLFKRRRRARLRREALFPSYWDSDPWR